MTKICKAIKAAHSDFCGPFIILTDEADNYIGTLAITMTKDPLRVADQVVAAINAQASREGDQS